MQMAYIANELDTMPIEKSDEVKSFVRCLEDYVLEENAKLKESVDFWEERYWILNDVYKKAVNENENAELQLTKAKDHIRNLLPFEHAIDPYAFTSDIEENKRRFHEPFRKAEQFLKEIE